MNEQLYTRIKITTKTTKQYKYVTLSKKIVLLTYPGWIGCTSPYMGESDLVFVCKGLLSGSTSQR